MRNNFSSNLILILIIIVLFMSFPLSVYILKYPLSLISKLAFKVDKITSFHGLFEGSNNGRTYIDAAWSLLFILLIPLFALLAFSQIYGKRLLSVISFVIQQFVPFSRRARFYLLYANAKFILGLKNNTKIPPEIVADARRRGLSVEEMVKSYGDSIPAFIEKMKHIDPESPLLSEVVNEYYGTTSPEKPDTYLSGKVREWLDLDRKMREQELDFQRTQEASGIKITRVKIKRYLKGIAGGLIFLLTICVFIWFIVA